MPWFWGSKKAEIEEEESSSDDEEYSEYSSDEEGQSDSAEEDESAQDEDDQSENSENEEAESSSNDENSSEECDSESSSQEDETTEDEESTPQTKSSSEATPSDDNRTPSNTTNGIQRSSYAQEFDDEEDDDDDDDPSDEMNEELQRIEAGVPEHVVGNRARAPSILSMGGTDDEEEEESVASTTGDTDESVHSDGSQDQEHVTTLAEKQSLLVLAAEHDRVDILNSVMSNAEDEETKTQLLHGGIPPLHIAVLNGSTNTATCLLRMGADPSIRPNVKEIAENQDPQAPLDVPKQIDNLTAWEIVFTKKITPKAKHQGIMHAFTAEALRCMGSDEGSRLKQLLDSGMPSDMTMMGDRSLYEWAVELGAPLCEEVLRPAKATADHETNSDHVGGRGKSAVLDRPGSEETAEQLSRQLEELESLAKALSTCLDNLAEEVSVSHGLLLMGGGGSALASHVRSLKTIKEQKFLELSRYQDALENMQDELGYWVKKAGPRGEAIAEEETPIALNGNTRKPPPRFTAVEEEKAFCEDLRSRIGTTNDKIRKFRASITDLSEENNRNIQEVEKRGLTGGINLVRGLKDEIREIDFAIEEVKVAEAVLKAKIDKIQLSVNDADRNGAVQEGNGGLSVSDAGKTNTKTKSNLHASSSDTADTDQAVPAHDSSENGGSGKASERIASGKSTALVVRRDGPAPGLFPLSLWQILLRIIGLRNGRSTRPPQRQTSSSYDSQTPMVI